MQHATSSAAARSSVDWSPRLRLGEVAAPNGSGVMTARPSGAIDPRLRGATSVARAKGSTGHGRESPPASNLSQLLADFHSRASLANGNCPKHGYVMTPHPQPSSNETPGFAARRIAADILDGVLRRARPLDEQLDGKGAHVGLTQLAERDRALVRRIVASVLRRLGSLRHVVGTFLDRGLPRDAPRAETALLIGAAQILLMGGPAHAAVDLSVRLAQADRHAARYAGLINAVLRRLAREGARQRDRAGARSHRPARRGRLGRQAARPRAADRLRPHPSARPGAADA